MKLRDVDLEWLSSNFPALAYVPEDKLIIGELRFCGAYDRNSGQLRLDTTGEHRAIPTFLSDAFKVRFDLGCVGENGWPKVYEVGGRRFDIAERNQCEMIDLHFYEDGACCLTLNFSTGRNLSLQRYLPELVIPFFYRLSYTDRFGLIAARADLWGEYSHGDAGVREYQNEVLRIGSSHPSRNQPCPCGSGLKYKRCHLDETQAVEGLWLNYRPAGNGERQ